MNIFEDDDMKIDKHIEDIDKAICRYIDQFEISGRGVVSQDILKRLRDLVEHIALKIYGQGKEVDNDWETIKVAMNYIKSKAKWKDLSRFHEYLQISVSHYTLDEENSERLMLKYYVHLWKLRRIVEKEFSMNILANLDEFPLIIDNNVQEYYDIIADKVKCYAYQDVSRNDKYYIQKIKPFFSRQRIYYEVTFTPANDYSSKFERIIAFTDLEITDFYSAKFSLVSDNISLLGKTMPIMIITGWEVSVRDCEFKNFSKIVRAGETIKTGHSEQQRLCKYLTKTGLNLVELVDFSEEEFQKVKDLVTQRAKSVVFFKDLERCREIITAKYSGSNLLRYLLLHLNNKILKNQQGSSSNIKLSGLYANNGCIPFDSIPFNFSPLGHNPRLSDLFICINPNERQHEMLARLVRNNTEIQGKLFTPVDEVAGFNDLNVLVNTYNNVLWSGHRERSRMVIEKRHIFINSYKCDTQTILAELGKMSQGNVQNYENSVRAWLNGDNHGVDCEEKKKALVQMFKQSKVSLIYGSAGTGKSTLINHVAHFFADKEKLFLAHTNPAVDNLKRRVTASSCTFSTIAKFIKRRNEVAEYDILIIDECSTVSNRDMCEIIAKADYKLLILVGDTYQIDSIRFGNWFDIARAFIPETAVFELTKPYRSNDKSLKELWSRVRSMDDTILELITKQGYSVSLDATIFTPSELDEIILCLNYDGLYGINNINRFLQESNSSVAVQWGIQQYKINDPILFNESDRFYPVIYNNMKGRIVGISVLEAREITEHIRFDVELDKVINELDAWGQDFELLEDSESGNSVVRFSVYKRKSEDEDEDGPSLSIMPFQVAYAVSIHKAQGLEYDSVKVVITDEIDELITHSIFYTAITRARSKLKIYWTPEVEQKVLSNIKPKNISKDVALLKSMI